MSDTVKSGFPSDRPGRDKNKKVDGVEALSLPLSEAAEVTGPAAVPSEPGSAIPQKIYRCGTLKYTTTGLVILFAWMLWGDFCFTLMEAVVPSIMPLKLRSLGSANWIIALIMSTLPGIFNTTVCPWVSFKSDRYRSKWGRRIPFILYTMPFLTMSLVCIGLSDQIGVWLYTKFLIGSTLKGTMVLVVVLAVFAAMFDLFNMFVGSVYYYLFNDVVPEEFLARFMSWFKLVGVISGALYNFFIFQYALSHIREIYIGAALLYLIGFGLMCLRVKEREYPPPPDEGEAPSLARDIKTFARECYTIPYYWNIFLYTMFNSVAGTIGVFTVFFNQSMGLDYNMIGKIGAVSGVLIAICLIFAGILVDRWHPVRVEAYLYCYNTFFTFGSLIWLFANAPSPKVYFWTVVLSCPFSCLVSAALLAANMPRQMILFPKDRFGAFCGAQALIRSVGTMIGGLIAGLFLDMVRQFYPLKSLYPYRYLYIWVTVFTIVAFCFYYRAYRYWKRSGGDTGYVPPTRRIRFCDLPKAANVRVVRGLLVLPIVGFAGTTLFNAFYVYYYYVRKHDMHSALAYGIYLGVAIVVMLGYLRFVKFMERA